MTALTPRLAHQFAIIMDAGYTITPGMRVLDLGCGEGVCVAALRAAGYEVFGCDVEMRTTPQAKALIQQGLLLEITMQPYRLPFDDATFDVVLSDEVFEHVQDYPEAIYELNRVMKPGAVSLHLFPARWMPIEPHVHVPFASVIRAYPLPRQPRRHPHPLSTTTAPCACSPSQPCCGAWSACWWVC